MTPDQITAAKAFKCTSSEELEGFRDRILLDKRMSLEISAAIANRKIELLKAGR